jgi:hypothetical protein
VFVLISFEISSLRLFAFVRFFSLSFASSRYRLLARRFLLQVASIYRLIAYYIGCYSITGKRNDDSKMNRSNANIIESAAGIVWWEVINIIIYKE